MPFPRHQRISLALAALLLVCLIAFYTLQQPTPSSKLSRLSSASAKIAGAKERLQQSLEEQNRELRAQLGRARASLKDVAAAAAAKETAVLRKEGVGAGEGELIEGDRDAGVDSGNGTDVEGFAYVFYGE